MAFISGTLGSVATIGKVLGETMTKKKLMEGAKNALKDKAKDSLKKRLTRKKKGGPGGPDEDEGGSIVQSSPGSIVPTSPLMGDIVVPYPEEPAKVKPKTTGVVNYKTITEQLESIVALTGAIEQVTGKSIKTKKKINETNRKNKEKAAKRAKEEEKEGGGGVLGFLGQKAKEVGEASGIFNFLANVFTGFIVVNLLPLIPGIIQGIKFLTVNLHLTFLAFRGIAETVGLIGKSLRKTLNKNNIKLAKLGAPIKKAFSGLKNGIGKLFSALGELVPKFVRSGFNLLGKATQTVANLYGKAGQALGRIGNTTTDELGKTKKGLDKLTGSAGKGVTKASDQAFRLRKLHGDEAARMYQGLVDNGMSNAKAAKYVNKQIKAGKIVSAPMKGSLGGGIKGSQVFKGGPFKAGKRAVIKYLGPSKVVKASLKKIPVIGPLIVGVTSLLSGEPAAQALFKAGGALIGGLVGTAIPIPILGPIIGELIGEYFGDLVYTMLLGGGTSALMEKMKKDLTEAMSMGQKAMKWVGNGFERFIKGVPKLKVPDAVPTWLIPEQFRSIPDPVWMIDPFNIMDKMGLFWKAFFTTDSMGLGEEEDKAKDSASGKGDKPKRAHFRRGTKGTRQYKIALAEWEKENGGDTPSTPDSPPSGSSESGGGGGAQSAPIVLGERSGSDSSGLKSVPPSSSQSKVDFSSSGGDKSRRIFLHWTAGQHNKPYSYYHTVFLGDGKAVRYTPYGQDKYSHTMGANNNSVGLSVAAMHEGGENQTTWKVPPTSAQIDAMVTEAAMLANDWGWDSSTVDKNVMTHGEWERQATRSGVLPAPAQRWDLDKLKPSDPRIDTSKVMSHGGNQLRAMIKAKMASLKAEGETKPEEENKPEMTPDAPPPSTELKKPDKKDYKGRSGAKQYAKDMMAYTSEKEKKDEEEKEDKEVVTNPEVQPTTPKAGDVKPEEQKYSIQSDDIPMDLSSKTDEELKGMLDPTMMGAKNPAVFDAAQKARKEAEEEGLTPEQTERRVLEATVQATHGNTQAEDVTPESTPPSQPEMTPTQSPSSAAQPVQKQASYDQPGGGQQSPVVLPPKQAPQMSGGGGGSNMVMLGSGNVLNSYYKAQLIGFLYKQG